jgi:hypothetical protein
MSIARPERAGTRLCRRGTSIRSRVDPGRSQRRRAVTARPGTLNVCNRRFEPTHRPFGHYRPVVPESPHIRVYIPAYPGRFQHIWWAARFAFYLQMVDLGH